MSSTHFNLFFFRHFFSHFLLSLSPSRLHFFYVSREANECSLLPIKERKIFIFINNRIFVAKMLKFMHRWCIHLCLSTWWTHCAFRDKNYTVQHFVQEWKREWNQKRKAVIPCELENLRLILFYVHLFRCHSDAVCDFCFFDIKIFFSFRVWSRSLCDDFQLFFFFLLFLFVMITAIMSVDLSSTCLFVQYMRVCCMQTFLFLFTLAHKSNFLLLHFISDFSSSSSSSSILFLFHTHIDTHIHSLVVIHLSEFMKLNLYYRIAEVARCDFKIYFPAPYFLTLFSSHRNWVSILFIYLFYLTSIFFVHW